MTPAEDENMGADDEVLSEGDLMPAEEGSDGMTRGAAQRAAPRKRGDPSHGKRGNGGTRRSKSHS